MGLNFFSLVLSLARVPEVRSSEYLVRRVCSSTSDHFFRFIFGGFPCKTHGTDVSTLGMGFGIGLLPHSHLCHVTTINTIFIFIFIFIFFGAFLIRVLEYILKMPLYKFYDPVDFVLLDNKLFKGTDLGAII